VDGGAAPYHKNEGGEPNKNRPLLQAKQGKFPIGNAETPSFSRKLKENGNLRQNWTSISTGTPHLHHHTPIPRQILLVE